MKTQLILAALLSTFLLHGEGAAVKTWQMERDRAAVSCRNGAKAVYPKEVKNGVQIALPAQKGKWSPSVSFVAKPGLALKKGEFVFVTFKISATAPVKGRIVISQSTSPYRHQSDPVSFEITKVTKSFSLKTRVWRDIPVTEAVNLPTLILDGTPGAVVKIQDLAVKKAVGGKKNAAKMQPLSSGKRTLSCRNGAKTVTPKELKNGVRIMLPAQKGPWSPSVSWVEKPAAALKKGEVIFVTFKASATAPVKGRIVISQSAPPYRHASDPVSFEITKDLKSFSLKSRVWRDIPVTEAINLPILILDGEPGAAVTIQDLAVQKK